MKITHSDLLVLLNRLREMGALHIAYEPTASNSSIPLEDLARDVPSKEVEVFE